MVPAEIYIPVLATVTWYLAVAAQITEVLWKHYPPRFEAFMACPACAGTWIGLAWELALGARFLGYPRPLALALAGLWCTFSVPVLAWLLLRSLNAVYAIIYPPKKPPLFPEQPDE